MSYAGADWIRSCITPEISPFGEAVANLLGDVFFGIYHLDKGALEKVNWKNSYWIEFILGWKTLSTVDFNNLTVLVVLAHDRMIRVSIEPRAFNYMRLLFHQRYKRDGSISERCPTIEEHIRQIREHYKDARASDV